VWGAAAAVKRLAGAIEQRDDQISRHRKDRQFELAEVSFCRRAGRNLQQPDDTAIRFGIGGVRVTVDKSGDRSPISQRSARRRLSFGFVPQDAQATCRRPFCSCRTTA
jgi:hypothetical protein